MTDSHTRVLYGCCGRENCPGEWPEFLEARASQTVVWINGTAFLTAASAGPMVVQPSDPHGHSALPAFVVDDNGPNAGGGTR